MSSRIVRVDPQVVFRRLGERMVLVHLGTNQIFELNETSARMWELLSEDGDVARVESRLGEEYEVGAAQLRHELDQTLALLAAERLITELDRA